MLNSSPPHTCIACMWPHSWPVPIVCLVFVDATIIFLTSLVCSLVFSIDSCSEVFCTCLLTVVNLTYFFVLTTSLLTGLALLLCNNPTVVLQVWMVFISINMNWKVDFLSFIRWFSVFCIMIQAYVVLWYVCNTKFRSPLNMSKSRTHRFLLCSHTILYSCALCCDCSDSVLWLPFFNHCQFWCHQHISSDTTLLQSVLIQHCPKCFALTLTDISDPIFDKNYLDYECFHWQLVASSWPYSQVF
jgi:hypothetical protein